MSKTLRDYGKRAVGISKMQRVTNKKIREILEIENSIIYLLWACAKNRDKKNSLTNTNMANKA